MKKIKAIIKKPNSVPYVTHVSNSLEALQNIVGGYIEAVTIASDMVIICNEEGRILGLPHNCNYCGVDFVGTIIFLGVNGDDFDDIPVDFDEFKEVNKNLWKVG